MAKQGKVRVKYEIEPGRCGMAHKTEPPCDIPAVFETPTPTPICHWHAAKYGFTTKELRLIGHETSLDELTLSDE